MLATKGWKRSPPASTASAAPVEETSTASAAAAAAASADIDDLLPEILLRLPIKSLARAKSVSKRWLSLISSPYFSLRRYPNSPSCLFLHRSSDLFYGVSSYRIPKVCYVPLDHDGNRSGEPIKAIDFLNENRFFILRSCNGLLCCCDSEIQNYFVINPTTKQFKNLNIPDLEFRHLKCFGVCLAFDPLESPYYKVVCVRDPGFSTACDKYFQIAIYSSETSAWRPSGEAFTASNYIEFSRGVFWNGAINWVSTRGDSLYFNVDQESLGTLPMPPMPLVSGDGKQNRKVRYFGESQNHLHLVEFVDSNVIAEFKIYEMERDYSCWFVRYSVALDEVIAAFPEIMVDRKTLFSIIFICRRENEDESILVLHIHGKVICYNLMRKTLKNICDLAPSSLGHGYRDSNKDESSRIIRFGWFNVYPYIESLASL